MQTFLAPAKIEQFHYCGIEPLSKIIILEDKHFQKEIYRRVDILTIQCTLLIKALDTFKSISVALYLFGLVFFDTIWKTLVKTLKKLSAPLSTQISNK